MIFNLKLPVFSFLLALFVLQANGQNKNNTTVFITKPDTGERTFSSKYLFRQAAISFPIRRNPYRNDRTDDNRTQIYDVFLPDGISAHFGYGLHNKHWIGLCVNTGIDFVGQQKLVTIPLYGSLLLNPQIWDEHSILFQYGLGHTFAIGRGSLSGTYQKYRLGIVFKNELSLYIEINRYGFPIKDYKEAGNFSIGFSILDFM